MATFQPFEPFHVTLYQCCGCRRTSYQKVIIKRHQAVRCPGAGIASKKVKIMEAIGQSDPRPAAAAASPVQNNTTHQNGDHNVNVNVQVVLPAGSTEEVAKIAETLAKRLRIRAAKGHACYEDNLDGDTLDAGEWVCVGKSVYFNRNFYVRAAYLSHFGLTSDDVQFGENYRGTPVPITL
jgi:hypothetical protein